MAKAEGAKVCSTTGCGTQLRSNNESGLCTSCRTGRPVGAPASRGGRNPAVRKQFRALTSALGIDGDRLLDRFCQGWIDNLKERATPAGDEL